MVPLFAGAMFASALLLFWIQPMFTKAVLPLLGGTPAVWNTALFFFQAALLTGYLYAHVSSRWLSVRSQSVLHVALLTVATLLALPVRVPQGWQPSTTGSPVLALLGLLGVSLGLPFVALSATAPLLQRWFSTTDVAGSEDPYFLYAASNLGSMVALIGYPFLLEPRVGLAAQHAMWSAGYVLVGILIAVTARVAWRSRGQSRPRAGPGGALPAARRPALPARVRWVLLALAPSSLLLGVTTYITTDVAAVPLLWILPLAIYLLTFVLAFSRRSPLPHRGMLRAMPHAALALTVLLCVAAYGRLPLPFMLFHLLVFFVLAMVCHGELARTRPPVENLTEFYLGIALGGVLGGALNALVAPVVFDTVAEYPLSLVLAVALAPPALGGRRLVRGDLLWPAGVLLASTAILLGLHRNDVRPGPGVVLLLIGSSLVLFALRRRPLRFGLALGALILAFSLVSRGESLLFRERTFYGVNAVLADPSGRYHVFRHGTTVHGAQSLDGPARLEPISYYVTEGPVGDVFRRLAGDGRIRHVAGIGLGTGCIACYREEPQEWTFYEIDPVVERIARQPGLFTYLAECAPDARVVLGDARLSLRESRPAGYDLIVIDVFTSDAIPVHMMTREAFELYLEKLAPDGFLLVNISNSFLHLRPVVAAIARDLGLSARGRRFSPSSPEAALKAYRLPSEWVVLARSEARLEGLEGVDGWENLETASARAWTDDYSNIFEVLHWNFRQRGSVHADRER
jgi:hypothetical protein